MMPESGFTFEQARETAKRFSETYQVGGSQILAVNAVMDTNGCYIQVLTLTGAAMRDLPRTFEGMTVIARAPEAPIPGICEIDEDAQGITLYEVNTACYRFREAYGDKIDSACSGYDDNGWLCIRACARNEGAISQLPRKFKGLNVVAVLTAAGPDHHGACSGSHFS